MIHSRLLLAVVLSVAGLSASRECEAQDRANPTRDDAVLVVDGVVREVFSSVRRDRVDLIVQIEVKRSEAVRSPRVASRVPMPAPGDMVYVHTSQRPNAALGLQGSDAPQATAARCRRCDRPGRAISVACLTSPLGQAVAGRALAALGSS